MVHSLEKMTIHNIRENMTMEMVSGCSNVRMMPIVKRWQLLGNKGLRPEAFLGPSVSASTVAIYRTPRSPVQWQHHHLSAKSTNNTCACGGHSVVQ